MQVQISSAFAAASAWGTKLAVFATLGAVGWWGHLTHWSLPAMQLTASEASPQTLPENKTVDRLATSDFPSKLPVIEFSSDAAVRNCGIEIAAAKERQMDDVIVANGVVGFDQTRYAQLATRVPGIVWRVEKRVGDTVQSGDILVIVDSTEVGQAKAALLESAVTHNLKAQTLHRLEQIPESVAHRQIQEAEAEHKLAVVQRFNALQKLVNFGFPIHLDEITQLSTDKLTSRLQLLGLPANLASETSSANLIPLVAPFSGVITTCNVAQGEMVEPAKPQYVVADMRHMWIHLDIQQEDANRLQLGATALVRSEGDIDPIPCRITWIGAEVDPKTRTIQARAEADNPLQDASQSAPGARRKLRVNAFCSADIRVSNNPSAVVVHNDALHLQWEIGQQIVFVASPDRLHFEPRLVTKGLVRDDYVQIIDGLKAGELVVTAGSRILASELSERLQSQVGENNDAVRNFDNIPVSATP
ncbi:MAG: efflux RND transporter periplasmic adaptor subunit [Planctomycetota bacterium]